MKNRLQRFGKFLSAMIMPNIGAFIAWGFITALFIPDGWFPNADLASIQPFMLKFLLPVLIAYTGGRMVGKDRGGITAAIAIIGCIAGGDALAAKLSAEMGTQIGAPTMLLAAMIIGPISGWVIKKFDQLMENRMPAGFEMLINNFSIGIFGMILAIIGYYGVAPLMGAILDVLSAGVEFLVDKALLPLVAILVEPAKVLFLNNAINHGVFTPIGIEQAAEAGKSIMYMIEANPGPGLGVLMAYWIFSKNKVTKSSAPGAVIIHFFGGIHEIYFPYILMNPLIIIGPMVGNIFAILFYTITGSGLVSAASPGSIIAFLGMAPKGETVLVALGVLISAAISFVVSALILRMVEGKGGKSLEEAQGEVKNMKAKAKGLIPESVVVEDAKKIVFACDAGMGSSAMGATKFRNRIKNVRPDIVVTNTSVDTIPEDCDVVVVQNSLQDRAKANAPWAKLIVIHNFLQDPELDSLYKQLMQVKPDEETVLEQMEEIIEANAVLLKESIQLNQSSVSKEEAIRRAGELLVERGAVEPEYVEAMIMREKMESTYIGMGVAIPHGTSEAKAKVKKTAIVMLQYPDGVEFGKEKAHLVFGIAGIGDEHLELLGKIASALENPEVLDKMITTDDVDWIHEILS